MLKSFTIRSTFKCNFNCSFCAQKEKLTNPGEENEEKIIEFLKNNKYDHYVFSGGEPLLKFDFIKKLNEYLPKESTKTIHSNASLLTEEIVEWMNKNKIGLCFSINGIEVGEKSLKYMIENSPAGESLPDLIRKINWVGIKKVILKGEKKEDILLSIYAIHQTFPKSTLSLVWDYWDLESVNVDDFFNMEFILTCLKKFDPNFTEWFDFKGAPCIDDCKECLKSGGGGINPDGTTFHCVLEGTNFKRCSLEQEELFNKIKNQFYNKTKELK